MSVRKKILYTMQYYYYSILIAVSDNAWHDIILLITTIKQ